MGLSKETLPNLYDFKEDNELNLYDLNENSSDLNLTDAEMSRLYAKLLENEAGGDEYNDEDFDNFEANVDINDNQKENRITSQLWHFSKDDNVHKNDGSEDIGYQTPQKKLKTV